MKKVLLVLLLIAAFAAPAFSQTECPAGSIGGQKTKKMVDGENHAKKVVNKQKGSPDIGC
jgi:hypothetical protein